MMDALGVPQSVLLLGGTSDIALAIARRYATGRRDQGSTLRVVLAARPGDRRDEAERELAEAGCTVRSLDFEATDPSSRTAVVEQAFADWDAEPLLARLAEVGVPAGKVRTLDEVYEWDQVASQGLITSVQHATLGEVTLPGPPLRFFDRSGAEATRTEHRPPPTLDQHGSSVREWLGSAE